MEKVKMSSQYFMPEEAAKLLNIGMPELWRRLEHGELSALFPCELRRTDDGSFIDFNYAFLPALAVRQILVQKKAIEVLTWKCWGDHATATAEDATKDDIRVCLLDSDYLTKEKPLETKERNVLLTIIGVLCREAKLSYDKPAKTAAAIHGTAASMGITIGESTIEGHLKKVPEALGTRMR